MKKLLLLGLGLLGLPFIAFGAYEDVSITSPGQITVGSDTVTIAGTGLIESLEVGASSFTVTLATSSSVTLQSTTGKTLSASGASSITSVSSCEGGVGAVDDVH